jgi:hypothetical protein
MPQRPGSTVERVRNGVTKLQVRLLYKQLTITCKDTRYLLASSRDVCLFKQNNATRHKFKENVRFLHLYYTRINCSVKCYVC